MTGQVGDGAYMFPFPVERILVSNAAMDRFWIIYLRCPIQT